MSPLHVCWETCGNSCNDFHHPPDVVFCADKLPFIPCACQFSELCGIWRSSSMVFNMETMNRDVECHRSLQILAQSQMAIPTNTDNHCNHCHGDLLHCGIFLWKDLEHAYSDADNHAIWLRRCSVSSKTDMLFCV